MGSNPTFPTICVVFGVIKGMYISGDITDYASRLHQLPENLADLASFEAERNSYSGISTVHEVDKWENEHNRWLNVLDA